MIPILGPILEGAASLFKGVVFWMTGYGSDKTIEARRMNDNQKKLDEFRKDQSEGNLDEIRKKLSDNPPGI